GIGVGLQKPRVYVIDDPAPNAFATGRNPRHSAVAATTGLLQIMDRAELEGVLAHELSHVRNYDILISTIAVTLVGFLALLCDLGLRLLFFGGLGGGRDDNGGDAAIFIIALSLVFIILAPIAAKLLQFAASRRREALADVSGVYITRNPQGLISALEKLRENSGTVHHAPAATAHMWIESPLDKREGHVHGWFNRLFETHPPLEQRIAALQEVVHNDDAGRGGNDGRHFQRKEAFAHWRYRRPARRIPSGPHRSHSRRHKQRLRRLAEYADSSGASRGGRAGGRDLHVAPKRLV